MEHLHDVVKLTNCNDVLNKHESRPFVHTRGFDGRPSVLSVVSTCGEYAEIFMAYGSLHGHKYNKRFPIPIALG